MSKNKNPIWKETQASRQLRLELTDGIKYRSKTFSKGEDLNDHKLQRRKNKQRFNSYDPKFDEE